MSDTAPLGRRPSDRLDELRDQLLRELKRLESEGGEEPELFRAYLQHAQVLAWRGIAEGRMDAPREILDALRAAEPFVYFHGSSPLSPAGSAALEVHFTLRSLKLAVDALEERRVEDRLADDRSETEREILRVLFINRGRYLRRGDIHKRLELEEKPTPARVGQILVELHYEGLLTRVHGRAQGNPNAAYYALSPVGVDVCRNLELVPEHLERIREAVHLALDSSISDSRRSLVTNMLANGSIGPFGRQILETLDHVVRAIGTDQARQLYQEVCEQVQLTRRVAITGGKSWTVEQPEVKDSGMLTLDPVSESEKISLQRARSKEIRESERVAALV